MPFRILNTIAISAFLVLLTLVWLEKADVKLLVLVCVLYLLILGLGIFFIRLNFFNQNLNRASNSTDKIAITFDDGPTDHTEAILDVLKEKNVKASFFCIGSRINKNSDLLKRISTEGHDIGNHTFNHYWFFPFLSREKVKKELAETEELIRNFTGRKTALFRPPFGVTNPTIVSATNFFGYKIVGWSKRTLDGAFRNKRFVLKRATENMQGGDVILLHDNYSECAETLRKILDIVEKKGLKPVTISELFEL